MPSGIPNPNTIKPDMSDYPHPGTSDPEAHKAWQREYNRRYRALNPPIHKIPKPNTIKPDMSDYPNPGTSDPDYEAWKREYGRRWRKCNPEKVRAYWQKKWDENRERELEKGRRWRERNPEKMELINRLVRERRAADPEGARTAARIAWSKWYKDNPEAREYSRNKHAARRGRKVPLTEQERQQLVILEQKRLHLTETTGIVHHLDHIMPLSKGGIHHPINLRIITAHENISKHNKVTPEAMALIPQIQAIVQERKDWIRDDEDGNLMSLLV
jgi:hypothetical protein